MAPLSRPPVRTDIVEEHFDELEFLWELRESVVFAPDWDLQELAELEERADAHLDGLVLAQGHAVDLAVPALERDRSAATAATRLLFALGEPELEHLVLDGFAGAEPDLRDGMRIGLRHSDVARHAVRLRELAAAGDPESRIAALDALAFHRLDPGCQLDDLLRLETRQLAALLPALTRLGGPWGPDDLRRALDAGDPALAQAAWRASACLGVAGLAQLCRARVDRDPADGIALEFLGVIGDATDLPRFERGLASSEKQRALAGLGALGTGEGLRWLLEAMVDEDDGTSAAAAAAFGRITGVDVLASERPMPAESPDDEDDFRDEEPRGDAAKAQEAWAKLEPIAPSGARWQEGKPLGLDTPEGEINALQLRFRADAFLARAARGGGPVPELECRAITQLHEVARVAPPPMPG